MSWIYQIAGRGRDERRKRKEQRKLRHEQIKRRDERDELRGTFPEEFIEEKKQLVPSDKEEKPRIPAHVPMNVRDVYSLNENAYKNWALQNPDKVHFFPSYFIDSIYKVHRPGKLSYRRGKVPIQEIAEWCKKAKANGVSDAFVLLPEKDLDDYYSIVDPSTHKILRKGKDVFFDVYDAYGINIHHYPIRDFDVPKMATMVKACEDLKKTNAEAEKDNKKVVVHCSAGIGRTGLLTSCYLVSTGRLTHSDTKAIKDSVSWSKGGYQYVSPTKETEMQKKIWFDNSLQLSFINRFAKTKEFYESQGKQINDPDVLKEIERDDFNREQEELKKSIEREKASPTKVVKPVQKFKQPPGGIDDWYKNYQSKKIREDEMKRGLWAKNQLTGEWERLDETTDHSKGTSDVPPEGYTPTWMSEMRSEIDSLKRRGNERNYSTNYNNGYNYNYQDNITEVSGIRKLFKGRRPGYPRKENISKEEIENYAEKMKERGITDVFVLLSNEELQKYYAGELLPVYETVGLRVHHYPIKDFGAPTQNEALNFASDLDEVLGMGGSALIHCSAGIGRTGTMISAYQAYRGLSPEYHGQSKEQTDLIEELKNNMGYIPGGSAPLEDGGNLWEEETDYNDWNPN